MFDLLLQVLQSQHALNLVDAILTELSLRVVDLHGELLELEMIEVISCLECLLDGLHLCINTLLSFQYGDLCLEHVDLAQLCRDEVAKLLLSVGANLDLLADLLLHVHYLAKALPELTHLGR